MIQVNLEVLPSHFDSLLQQPPPTTPAPALHATTTQGPLSPPLTLLSSIPLSAVTNYLLTCFNDLRHCAPLSLAPQIAQLLHKALATSADLLLRESSGVGADLKSTRQLMASTLLPYIERCFSALFELKDSPLVLKDIITRLTAYDTPAPTPSTSAPSNKPVVQPTVSQAINTPHDSNTHKIQQPTFAKPPPPPLPPSTNKPGQ